MRGSGLNSLLPPKPGNDSETAQQGLTDTADSSSSSTGGMLSHLADNPLFSAGAGMAGLGVAMTFARKGLIASMMMLQKYGTVSLEIPSKDKSYQWVIVCFLSLTLMSYHILICLMLFRDFSTWQCSGFTMDQSPGWQTHTTFRSRNHLQTT